MKPDKTANFKAHLAHQLLLKLMKVISYLLFLTLAVPLTFSKAGLSMDAVVIDNDVKSVNIVGYLQVFKDVERKFEIRDILDSKSELFTKNDKDIPNYGIVPWRIWVKFSIQNKSEKDLKFYLELDHPYIGDLQFFAQGEDGDYFSRQGGIRFPLSTREIKNRNPVFPITLKRDTTATCYIRLESNGPIAIPLTLYSPESFYEKDHESQYIFGIYSGIIVGLILFNMFFYILIKENTYLTYVWMMAFGYGVVVQSLYGISTEYMWPSLPWWSERQGPFSLCMSAYVFGRLCQKFLNIRIRLPRVHNIISILCIISLGGGLAILIFFNKFTFFFGIVIFTLILLFGFIASVRDSITGYRPAILFSSSWAVLVISAVLYVFYSLGILPMSGIIQYLPLIGAAIQSILISFAVADHINMVKKEKLLQERKANLEAEKAVLIQKNANEQLTNMNEKLEELIRERTKAIQIIQNNVKSGFILIGQDLTILEGFTKSCCELLGDHIKPGLSLSEAFKQTEETNKRLACPIQQIFDDTMPDEISLSQLPKTLKVDNKVISIEGAIIRNHLNRADVLLLTLNDHTLLAMANQKIEHNMLLIKILHHKDAFRSFIIDVKRELARARSIIESGMDKDHGAALLSIMHTIKGNSTLFSLKDIVEAIHRYEETKTPTIQGINRIEKMFMDFLSANSTVIDLDYNSLDESNIIMGKNSILELSDIFQRSQNIVDLKTAFERWQGEIFNRPVGSLLGPVADNVEYLAKQMGKEIDFILIGENINLNPHRFYGILRNITHLIRNSIDHGIEPPSERGTKPKRGKIVLTISKDDQKVLITVADDGRGIDFKKISKIALKKNIVTRTQLQTMSENELCQLIFDPRLSSLTSISEISGRGVGLFSLRQAIDESGGKIAIYTKAGRGTRFDIDVPLKDMVKKAA
ncbi:MAG: hypothetical protein HQK54_11695 [Oligoflexales bacterium]|nr:hypothetical protein [Oligoflexales bacterium]